MPTPVDKNHVSLAQANPADGMPLDAKANLGNGTGTAAGRHQVFQKDTLGTTPQPAKVASKTIDLEKQNPTIWNKLFSWAYQTELKGQVQNQAANKATAKKPDPIDHVPPLEKPDNFPADLEGIKLPPVPLNRTSRKPLTQEQMMEGFSHMSDQTIEQIMFIVMKGQLELEKENANVAENTFTKYQNIRKLRQKVLEEIKDVLAKDEKFLGWAKTAQSAAFVASFVCSLFTAGVTIASAIGFPPAGIPLAIATYAPVVAAGFIAVTKGTTAYTERRFNEDQAQHTAFRHLDKSTSDLIEEAQERLIAISDTDQVFKERLIKQLKRITKMNQIVLQR